MKEIAKIFSNNFVLRTVNDIDNLDFVNETKLEVRPAEYEEPQNASKSTKFQKMKSFLKKENISEKQDIKSTIGEVYIHGERYCIGDASLKVATDKSIGKLVALPVYHQYGDDMIGRYYPVYKGNVLLDENLNAVYKQCSSQSNIYESPSDCLRLLYEYGPCALSFLNEKDLASYTLYDEIKQTFDKRVEKLKNSGVLDYKIEEEQKQFKECCDIIENIQCNELNM